MSSDLQFSIFVIMILTFFIVLDINQKEENTDGSCFNRRMPHFAVDHDVYDKSNDSRTLKPTESTGNAARNIGRMHFYHPLSIDIETSQKIIRKSTARTKYMDHLPVPDSVPSDLKKLRLKNKGFERFPLVDILVAYNTSSLFGCRSNIGQPVTIVAYPVNTQLSSFICRTPDNTAEVRRASLDEKNHSTSAHGSGTQPRPRAASMHTISLHGQRYGRSIPLTAFYGNDVESNELPQSREAGPLSATQQSENGSNTQDEDSVSADACAKCVSHISDMSTPGGTAIELREQTSGAPSTVSESGNLAGSSGSRAGTPVTPKSEFIQVYFHEEDADGNTLHTAHASPDRRNRSGNDLSIARLGTSRLQHQQPAITGIFEARLCATIAGHGTLTFQKEFILDSTPCDASVYPTIESPKELVRSDVKFDKHLPFSSKSPGSTQFKDYFFQVAPFEGRERSSTPESGQNTSLARLSRSVRERSSSADKQRDMGKRSLDEIPRDYRRHDSASTEDSAWTGENSTSPLDDKYTTFRPSTSLSSTADMNFTDYSPSSGLLPRRPQLPEEALISEMSPMPRPDHTRRPPGECADERVHEHSRDTMASILEMVAERQREESSLEKLVPLSPPFLTQTTDLSFTDPVPATIPSRRKSSDELLINEMSPSYDQTRRPGENVAEKLTFDCEDPMERFESYYRSIASIDDRNEDRNIRYTSRSTIPFCPPSLDRTSDLDFTDYVPGRTFSKRIRGPQELLISKMSPMPGSHHVRRSSEEEAQAKRPVIPRYDHEEQSPAENITDIDKNTQVGYDDLERNGQTSWAKRDYVPFSLPSPTRASELSFTEFLPRCAIVGTSRPRESTLIEQLSPLPTPDHKRRPSDEQRDRPDDEDISDVDGEDQSRSLKLSPAEDAIKPENEVLKHFSASKDYVPFCPPSPTHTSDLSFTDPPTGNSAAGRRQSSDERLINKMSPMPSSDHTRTLSDDETTWYTARGSLRRSLNGEDSGKLGSVFRNKSEEFFTTASEEDKEHTSGQQHESREEATAKETVTSAGSFPGSSGVSELSVDTFDFEDPGSDDEDDVVNDECRFRRRATIMPGMVALDLSTRTRPTKPRKHEDRALNTRRRTSAVYRKNEHPDLHVLGFVYPTVRTHLSAGSKEAIKYTVMQQMLDYFHQTGMESIRRIEAPVDMVSSEIASELSVARAGSIGERVSSGFRGKMRPHQENGLRGSLETSTVAGSSKLRRSPIKREGKNVRDDLKAKETQFDQLLSPKKNHADLARNDSVTVLQAVVGDDVVLHDQCFEQSISFPELGDVTADVKISIDISFVKNEELGDDENIETNQSVPLSDDPHTGDSPTEKSLRTANFD